MLWFHSQNKITSKAELALSSSSLTFSASGTTIDLNVITNIPANEVTYEVNSSGVFTVNKNGYTLTISTGNLGTTITPQQSSTITVKARNLTATCTLIRQANVITQTKVIRDNGAEAVSSFLASGGVGVYVCQNTFTSGSKNYGDRGNIDLWSCSLPGAIKELYTVEGDGIVYKATSFTIPSKRSTISDATNFTITTTDGIGATLNCTQAANKIENLEIRSWVDRAPITSVLALGIGNTWYHSYATYTSGTRSRVEGDYSGWSTNASWISIKDANTGTDNAVSLTIGSRGITPGAARSGSLSFIYGGKTATITITQAKNYITSLKIGGGSTTSLIPTTITWSAAGGSNPFTGWAVYTTGAQTCITTWAVGDWVLSESYFSKALSNGILTVTGEYRGTVVGGQRTSTLTVNLNSAATENKQLSASVTLTQAENKCESVRILRAGDFQAPTTSFSAAGGAGDYTAYFTMSAGDNREFFEIPLSAWTLSSTDGFKVTGNYFVKVTVSNRGSTLGDARSTTLKITYQGVSSQITLTQAANTRKATGTSGGTLTYSNITAGAITNATIPAKGGSATATAGVGKQSWSKSEVKTTYTYDSGATKEEVTSPATSGTNDVNPSIASINATASSKGTVVSNQTVVKSQAVTWSANSKSASGTMYIYQQENKVVSTEYAIPVISTFTYPDIPAKGGTVLPTISWSQTVEDTYTSEQSKDRTITTGGTVTYSGSAVNPQTGSYTQGTKGTTESARNKCITATVTVVANSRTGTKTTDIYQAANTKTTTYSDVTITTFGYAEAPASGSVLSPTLSYKQTKTDSYTSGSSVPTDITSGASVSYKGGTNTGVDGKVRIPSRGTVEGPRTGIEEVTVTVTLNSKSASSTVTVYQAANEVTSKKISPQDPVPTQETIPATQAGYSYSGGECDLVYKYSSESSKVAMSIGEPGASQYGLGVTFSLVDSSGNISASGNYVTFGANTTTSERYAIVNMKFVTNQSDWDSDIYQITITQEAKSGPGTLTIKFLGTAPRIAYYVQMLINGSAVTGPTRYSVQSSINGFTISEGELSYVLAINPGSGNILVNLADSNGGSPSYRAELTQPQAASLLNGTSISIFANKLA